MNRESVIDQVKNVAAFSSEVADKNPDDKLLEKIAGALEHTVKTIEKAHQTDEGDK